MNDRFLLIIALAATILAGIGKIKEAAAGNDNPSVILNVITLSFIGAVAIAILIALAASAV